MSERLRISAREFETLVEEALHDLPEEFSSLLENIAIVIEDEPTEEDLDNTEDVDEEYESESDDEESGDELLGLFRGIPRTEKSFDSLPALPDQVAIFRGPILRVSESRQEAIREIRETVIHELGHYFGLSDEEMPF